MDNRNSDMDVYVGDVRQILISTLQLGDRGARLDLSSPLLGSIPELDSMAVVTILTHFEEQFGIEIHDDEVSAEIFETFGTLVEFVSTKCG